MQRAVILFVLISLGLASCGTLEVDIERNPEATSTVTVTLPPPPPASPYPTSAPTLAATPTAVLTLPATPAPVRIRFSSGATQSITQGTLQPGQSTLLVLRAMKGQVLVASIDTPNQDAILSIHAADGAVLPHMNPGTAPAFIAALPATQDYYFRLTGGNSPEPFTLSVVVAARIQFDAGQKKDAIPGRTVDGLPVTYSASAQKGQSMHVTLDAPGGSAALSIWGLSDGQPYLRAQSETRDFSLVLPSTQDYMIEVVPQAGRVVDYIITIQID